MIFSLIITTYNYEKFILKSLESALHQDFSGEYEIIVIDDCSTDNTSQILDKFDTVVKIRNSQNLSLEVSANKAIKAAKGKYVIRLDADDYLAPNFLSEMFKHLKGEETFYYSDYTVVSDDDTHLSQVGLIEFDKKEIECRGDFLATGTVYPKKMLLSVGLYSEEIKNSGLENYQLVLTLMRNGFKGQHVNKSLFFYRRHGGNLSSKKLNNILSYGDKLASRYGLDRYTINQYHPYLDSDTVKPERLLTYKKQ